VVKGPVARKQPAVPEELELVYRLEERIPLDGGAPSRHVERWAVSVLLDRPASGDLRAEIGYAHVLVFTLEPGRDIREFADRASGTWIDVEARADAPRSPADPDHDPERTGHIVLLDRVWLDPDQPRRWAGPHRRRRRYLASDAGVISPPVIRPRSTPPPASRRFERVPSRRWAACRRRSVSVIGVTACRCSTWVRRTCRQPWRNWSRRDRASTPVHPDSPDKNGDHPVADDVRCRLPGCSGLTRR
jgi:hypothetical protein